MGKEYFWIINPLLSTLAQEKTGAESVTLDRAGQVIARHSAEVSLFREDLGGGVTLDLILIPAGMFQMGSTRGSGYEDETPVRLVILPAFLLGRAPLTQAQWQAVTGKPPSCRFTGADLPVDRISWKESAAFCKRLEKHTGRPYRLPSEAQWEYACRAGSGAHFYTGETITSAYANYVGEHTFRDEPPGIYRHTTTPAGTFLPNAFGLYDMLGNLWEHCADRWHPDYSGAPREAAPWEYLGEKGCRVARGGSWHEPPVNCRCATRLRVAATEGEDYFGLRVMLPV